MGCRPQPATSTLAAVPLQAGQAAIERGDLKGALAALTRASQLDPQRSTFLMLAQVQRSLGVPGAAEQVLAQAEARSFVDAELLVEQGDTAAALGDWSEAEQRYRQALSLEASNADAWARLAAFATSVESCVTAERRFSQVVTGRRSAELLLVQAELAKCLGETDRWYELRVEALRTPRYQASRALSLARLYLRPDSENLVPAEALLGLAVKVPTASSALHALHGKICADLKRLDCAERSLSEAERIEWQRPMGTLRRPAVQLLQAQINVLRGRWERGARALRRLLPRLQGEQAQWATAYLGQALLGLGADEEAKRYLTSLPVDSEAYGHGQRALAARHEVRQEYAEAARVLRTLLRHKPNEAQAYLDLARNLAVQEQAEGAMAVLSQGLAAAPGVADLWVELGRLQWSSDAVRALGQVEQALLIDPQHPLALSLLASHWVENGQGDRAITLYEGALTRSLDPAPLQRALAMHYATAGRRLQRALHLARAASAAAPESAEAEATLGYVLFRNGRLSAALPHMEAAVAAAPGDSELREQLATLTGALQTSTPEL